MPFLLGKRIKGISVKTPLSEYAITLTDERKEELVIELQKGDLSAKDELVLHHIRLAIAISCQYAVTCPAKVHDIISESMLALTKGCIDVSNGAMHNTNITGFLVARIHWACAEHLRVDNLIRIPYTSKVRNNLSNINIMFFVEDWELSDTDEPRAAKVKDTALCFWDDSNLEITEELKECALSCEEERIIWYRLQGFNDREIAEYIGCSKDNIGYHRRNVGRRFIDRKLNERD